ncbi:short-chain dehydrogenase/reductase SDR [Coprinopsis cinerea okayama7|uniref:Short-chain dehydrogenase/reductase SDR n=1 Tax=Coprinopsis cinerea (strain Okayama-7 / 130 / ATCC MYA-4618 / FGSC 9003) TaxID=240176 RepID=A8NTJ3_COPC7|nr:short-chain dehydrogenase/reductase SDR [Coprinopsis cinerea okayama7\|eukprot:XP_001836244.1 short-chain dehydrogenase/reductase SDR [Coprinopsis cinerea okayama7\
MAKILDGKIAIITGASSGIGLATAKAFLDAGASVLGVDLSPAPSSITSEAFAFHQVDLTLPAAASAIVAAVRSSFPETQRIDILVNNAGIMDYNAGVAAVTDETWDKLIAVNVTAPVKLMREVVNVMKEQGGGSIVNVASKAGLSGAAAGVAYTASKHALLGVTKNTAWLYKDEGIRCNAVCPGAVTTNIVANIDRSKFDIPSFLKMKPVLDTHVNMETNEGSAPPERCAQAILFLASDLSTGITGAILPVDNGWSVI